MTSSHTLPQIVETRNLPDVVLGRATFTVTETIYSGYRDSISGEERPGSSQVWLHGARGATYFLREYLGTDTGVRQVISWKSGQPLRQAGNEIRVIRIGDVLEATR